MKKFVIWMDIHFGWEKARIGGKPITRPTHDIRMIKAGLKFIKDFQPDVFIAGGDNHNMSFISRHNKNKPRLVEGFSAKREYYESDRQLITPLEKVLPANCDKRWMLGNHEYWVELFLDENPTLEGIIEPEQYLHLEDRGWKIVDYGETTKIGKLFVIHGDTVRGASKYRAAQILNKYQRNIVSGHIHTQQTFVSECLADGDCHISYTLPMMGEPHPYYQKNEPNNAVQGFAYGYTQDNKNFNLYPVIASNHKFIINGKEYSG